MVGASRRPSAVHEPRRLGFHKQCVDIFRVFGSLAQAECARRWPLLREATAKPTISRKQPDSGKSLRSLPQNKQAASAQMHDARILKSQRTMDCISGMSVDAVMRQWPVTIRLFLAHGMGSCIGCPVGRLHTVREACSVSGVAVGNFVASLHETIQTISSTS